MNKEKKRMRRYLNKQIKKESKKTMGFIMALPFGDRLRVAFKILRGRA